MDEIISYKMCAVKVRNAKLRNYLEYVTINFRNMYCMYVVLHFVSFDLM
jgi:hypothetical protein